MERTISLLQLKSGENNYLKVQLYYSKGGMNYFTSKVEERGIYLSVAPVEIVKSAGYSCESSMAFSGIKQLVHGCARYNAKFFDAFVPDQEIVDRLVSHVLNKNCIQLAAQV